MRFTSVLLLVKNFFSCENNSTSCTPNLLLEDGAQFDNPSLVAGIHRHRNGDATVAGRIPKERQNFQNDFNRGNI
jgi:hypothetical protein